MTDKIIKFAVANSKEFQLQIYWNFVAKILDFLLQKNKWSSYSDYIRKNKKKLTDTSFMLNVIYDNYGSITFDDFIKKQSEFSIMEITQPHFRNDKSVINLIRKTLHLDSPQRIQSFSKELRNKCLKQFKMSA